MGFMVATVVGIGTVFVAAGFGAFDLSWVGFDWGNWLPLAAVGILGIFVQVSIEEMLFRGYITQFARLMVNYPWVFVTVPALLFAAPHISSVKALGRVRW